MLPPTSSRLEHELSPPAVDLLTLQFSASTADPEGAVLNPGASTPSSPTLFHLAHLTHGTVVCVTVSPIS